MRVTLRAAVLAVAILALAAAPARSARLDAADLGPFFDGLFTGLMAERRVPGAVVLVVQDGAVVFERGYGTADPATGRPVDPATTLFRVASVSKLFTATAVMQLVEQGKLDLDADVNGYLKEFQIPATFATPITLRHLLTHTPGFDDSFLNGSERPGDPMLPLGTYLARFLPRRVMEPGKLISYSNHGFALAGHVVEAVSGQPFRDYVHEHVLLPLGMRHSGFSLPDPPPPTLAVGTDWQHGAFVPVPLDRMRWYPAGDLYTSAGEIARFMLAHLDAGRIPGSDARILREETARAMQTQGFTHHPGVVGWHLGFDELRWNDVAALGHGGSWNGYGTALVLVPEAKSGIFVSTTRSNDMRFFRPLLRAFFDRYYPPATPRAAPVPDPAAKVRAGAIAGAYIPNRHVRGDLLRAGLFLGGLRIAANDDGSMTLNLPTGLLDPIRVVEMQPDLWQSDRDDTRVAVLRDAGGTLQRVAIDAFVYDRVPWWRDPALHQLAFGVCALLFAATLLGFGLGGVARRIAKQPPSRVPLASRLLACAGAALGLGAILAAGVGLAATSPFELFIEVPVWLRAMGVLSIASIPLAAVILFRSARARDWTPLARFHFAALGVAMALFATLAWSYNLMGLS
ncbi:MAG: beta-lactamase family protein [Myxococcota bacterium]|nr:beta-lactamase family protein [Myxococcota bacterium]